MLDEGPWLGEDTMFAGSQLNGAQVGYANTRLSSFVQLSTNQSGLVYLHFNNKPGAFIPAGSATCPGCFIDAFHASSVFLDTSVVF